MYDVSDEDSFMNVGYWMTNIQQHAAQEVEKILVGNKVDKPDKKIDSRQGQEIADEYKIKFFETSCKDGTNINSVFNALAEMIIKRQQQEAGIIGATHNETKVISSKLIEKKLNNTSCTIL